MTHRLALLALLAAAAAGRAEATPAAVRDDAGLFTEEGRRQAEEKIRDIRAAYHLDVVVRTVEAPPAVEQDRLKQARAGKERNRAIDDFFKGWGEKEAERAGVDGVHVLICKEVLPGEKNYDNGYVQVTVWPEGAHADLVTPADRRTLHDQLAKHLKKDDGASSWFHKKDSPGKAAQERDKVLLDALDQMRDALRGNSQPPFPWGVVAGVIAGVLALWGLLALVRIRVHKPDPAAGGKERPGFLAGLLGGLFGTAAGHWVYDTLFFHGPRASAPEAGAEAPASATPVPGAAPAEAPQAPAAAER